MTGPILVTYATRYGSTRDAAEKIAATLRELGFEADVGAMREVHSLEGYDAIVMGAPIEIGRWHGDAHHFLAEHHQTLKKFPPAIFALGPLHRDDGEMQEAQSQLDRELARYVWLRPAAVQMFVGRFDPTKLHFPASLFMKRIPASDEMDWDAVRKWAQALPAVFGLQMPSVAAEPQTV